VRGTFNDWKQYFENSHFTYLTLQQLHNMASSNSRTHFKPNQILQHNEYLWGKIVNSIMQIQSTCFAEITEGELHYVAEFGLV